MNLSKINLRWQRKGKSKPMHFINKFKTAVTPVFIQVSKYFRNCETFIYGTSEDKREKKKTIFLFTGNDRDLYLVHLKPLTIIILPHSLLLSSKARHVHRLCISLLSYARIMMMMTTGTAHRSRQTMFTLLFHDVIALYTQCADTTIKSLLFPHLATPVQNSMIKIHHCT